MKMQNTLDNFLEAHTDTREPSFFDRHPKLSYALETLGGGSITGGFGYMIANAYVSLTDPNAIYGYGMTVGQAEANGIAYPTIAFVTLFGGMFMLGGAYMFKSGISKLIRQHS